MDSPTLDGLTLGKQTAYAEHYDADLLQQVPRSLSRDIIKLPKQLPFSGVDVWNAYELSWLNAKGKPVIAILRCTVPVTSANLIESKSFKLYLNSYNQTKFSSICEVKNVLEKDLSACAGEKVDVTLIESRDFAKQEIGDLSGHLLDELDIEVENFDLSADTLITEQTRVSETLVSHLLKSNCLITNQPDWGSVQIKYEGNKINHEGLLRYLLSFRQHNEFHEQCVERIFYDIMRYCKPEKLTVFAMYTRRGGLDINPFRSNFESLKHNQRLARQ